MRAIERNEIVGNKNSFMGSIVSEGNHLSDEEREKFRRPPYWPASKLEEDTGVKEEDNPENWPRLDEFLHTFFTTEELEKGIMLTAERTMMYLEWYHKNYGKKEEQNNG